MSQQRRSNPFEFNYRLVAVVFCLALLWLALRAESGYHNVPAELGGQGAAGQGLTPQEQLAQLNQQVVQLRRDGKLEPALELATQAVALARQVLGPEHPDLATSLDNLGSVFKARGDYPQAESFISEALEIRRRTLGETDPDFVLSVNNLAGLRELAGRYPEAAQLFSQVRDTIGKAIGEENLLYARSLSNLASALKAMGSYQEAESNYLRAMAIWRQVSGRRDDPDLAIIQNNLAQLYLLVGRHADALTLFEESQELTRKSLGETHPQFARTLINLASLHRATANYDKAEVQFKQAVGVLQQAFGPNHPDVAACLNNLGELYKEMGDLDKAESLYQRALEIWRVVLGEKQPQYAAQLNNLGNLSYERGRFAEAESLYLQALTIQRDTLGEKHPDVADALNNLAVLHRTTGDYERAANLYQEALGICRDVYGQRHLNTSLGLQNLALLRHAQGRYPEAEALYLEALEIRTNSLGEKHADVGLILDNLAILLAATGRDREALSLMARARSIEDQILGQVFAIGSERLRLAYLQRIQGSYHVFLSLILKRLYQSAEAVESAYDLVLKRKGLTVEAMALEREVILEGRFPTQRDKLREIQELRRRLAQQLLAGPHSEGVESYRQMVALWRTRIDDLEAELVREIPELGLELRLRGADRIAVSQALPAGSALVEFVRFDCYDFQAIPAKGDKPWLAARYVAFVVVDGAVGQVRMIDLGEAAIIDQKIADFRAAITGEAESATGRGLATTSASLPAGEVQRLQEHGRALRMLIHDPLQTLIGDRRRIFIAPDGDINRIPIEVLPAEGVGCLIDGLIISYLGVGRDLLRFGEGPKEHALSGDPCRKTTHEPRPLPVARSNQELAQSVMIVADPDFDLTCEEPCPHGGQGEANRRISPELRGSVAHFLPLPGTRREGERIAGLFHTTAVVGARAHKNAMRSSPSPLILHLATHGFFLPEQRVDLAGLPVRRSEVLWARGLLNSGMTDRIVANPLLRSGLALAGANSWLHSKSTPAVAENGLLTAEDVTALDLNRTELVVLSACETGLGQIHAGEGVFGLRRAFLLAGAKSLVMSLWKVPDEQTADLMTRFYEQILKGAGRAEALRQAQLSIKSQYPHPLSWGAFICHGNPYPLGLTGSKPWK